MINVSIIVPTYKRKESVLRLLASLAPEMKKDYEIIISEQLINNGKSFKEFAEKNKIKLNYLFLKTTIGTSAAKNLAVKNAKGKYLVIFDDDVVVEKNIIKHLISNFKEKNIGAVGGRVHTVDQVDEPDRRDVGRITFFGKFTDAFSSRHRMEIQTVIGCNCAWRKDVFEKVGGFDEQFTGAIREDSDISLSTINAGYKIIFDPEAVVMHMREPTGGGRKSEGRLAWYFNFLSNETYFFLKHRPWFVVPIIILSRWEWILRAMFGFGREVSLKSVATPFLGIYDGVKKYRRFKNENWN